MFDMKQWRDEHRKHLRQYNRDYYAKNKEKILAQQREHRKEINGDKISFAMQIFGKEQRELTPEELRILYREKGRHYRALHDNYRELKKQWREKNREHLREYCRQYKGYKHCMIEIEEYNRIKLENEFLRANDKLNKINLERSIERAVERAVKAEKDRLYSELAKNAPEARKIWFNWYIPVREWGKTINKVFGHKEE